MTNVSDKRPSWRAGGRGGRLGARLAIVAVAAGLGVGLGACGSTGTSAEAPPPKDPNSPATGTLRTFTYDDTVSPGIIQPFEQQNPDVDLQTATFNSDEEAAAKLAGGFSADVVEVCADEELPLVERNLLRPIDVSAIDDWKDLEFTDADGVVRDGKVMFVPLSAGPQGLIANTDEVSPLPKSWNDLYDPKYKGRVALDGSTPLPLAETALGMGMDDPLNLTSDQLDEVKQKMLDEKDQFRTFADSDSDMASLFKSGEVVLADGGRGTTQAMIDDGLPVKWIRPKEGPFSWVCGLGITSKADNIDAAYKFINYNATPKAQAQVARVGELATNPNARRYLPPKFQINASKQTVKGAIPETQPPNFQEYARAWQEVKAQ